jgi:hypothetical protein
MLKTTDSVPWIESSGAWVEQCSTSEQTADTSDQTAEMEIELLDVYVKTTVFIRLEAPTISHWTSEFDKSDVGLGCHG